MASIPSYLSHMHSQQLIVIYRIDSNEIKEKIIFIYNLLYLNDKDEGRRLVFALTPAPLHEWRGIYVRGDSGIFHPITTNNHCIQRNGYHIKCRDHYIQTQSRCSFLTCTYVYATGDYIHRSDHYITRRDHYIQTQWRLHSNTVAITFAKTIITSHGTFITSHAVIITFKHSGDYIRQDDHHITRNVHYITRRDHYIQT